MRPIGFSYYGGKLSHVKRLIPLMPEGEYHFVDLFGGGGSVILNAPYKSRSYNDLNSSIYNCFWVLRHHPEELLAGLRLTPYSEEELRRAIAHRDEPIDDQTDTQTRIERAREFFTLLSVTHSGLAFKATPGMFSFKMKSDSSAGLFARRTDRLEQVVAELRTIQIFNCHALMLIKRMDKPQTFFYCDPPYMASTRSAGWAYADEMSDEDHEAMLDRLNNIEAKCMISGYASPLYDRKLADWRRVDYNKKTSTPGKGARPTDRTESVWMNY